MKKNKIKKKWWDRYGKDILEMIEEWITPSLITYWNQ